jgi:hypothetical protein
VTPRDEGAIPIAATIVDKGRESIIVDRRQPPAWLLRELIVWRGLAVLLMIIFTGVSITSYLMDQKQHTIENADRTERLTRIESGVAENGTAIILLDDHLRDCLQCHAHPNIDSMLQRHAPLIAKPPGGRIVPKKK